MESVFLKMLNMSITASWLIVAVMVFRVLFRKAPKSIRGVLWAFVGIRLVFPFSFQSVWSLIPSAETISPDILYNDKPVIHSGIPLINQVVNPVLSESMAPAIGASVNPLQIFTSIASVIWLIGLVALLAYALVSYVRLRRLVRPAMWLQGQIWLCDRIHTPFILGMFKPRIYLPSDLEEPQRTLVVAHELAHLARRDHWWKPLGFILLAVYWFNPLVWLAYVLLSRDIELACDEQVVKEMGLSDRKAYSETLLTLGAPRRQITACPLAFGEVGVKQRIRHVLDFRRPAFWIIVIALLSCLVVAVFFLTNPLADEKQPLLNYKNLVSLAKQSNTLPVSLSGAAGDSDGVISGEALAAFLDEAAWTEQRWGRSVQRDANKSTASIEVLMNGTVWLRLFNTDTARIYTDGKERYYRMPEGDYAEAFQLVNAPPSTEGYPHVSIKCLYMNPLSSQWGLDDSGLRYYIGADTFMIERRDSNETMVPLTSVTQNWQNLEPAVWSAFFKLIPPEIDIFATFQKPQWRMLSDRYYLFDMDGTFWIGQYNGEKVGMWNLYMLTPEVSGLVLWEYQPLSSARYPAFPFRFQMDYSRIEATCDGGFLIGYDNHDGTAYPMGQTLSFPAGSALYWAPHPVDGSAELDLRARIDFTVYRGDEVTHTGTISLACTQDSGPIAARYEARLVEGKGLVMIPATDEKGGGLIVTDGSSSVTPTGGSTGPTPIHVAQADLDRDGSEEAISVLPVDDGMLFRLIIEKADGTTLWQTEMATAHVGWNSLFLCTIDNQHFLLQYNPTMFQGECSYGYRLFTLEDGQETIRQTREVAFDVNGRNLLDVDALTSFAEEVNKLFKSSILLLSTEGGEAAIGPGGTEKFREFYSVLLVDGVNNLTEAVVVRAAQVFVRNQSIDLEAITNFYAPSFKNVDASRFSGLPILAEDYDKYGPFYEVVFEIKRDTMAGSIIVYTDGSGTVFAIRWP